MIPIPPGNPGEILIWEVDTETGEEGYKWVDPAKVKIALTKEQLQTLARSIQNEDKNKE